MNCSECQRPLIFKNKSGSIECGGFLHITDTPFYVCEQGHEFLKVDRLHIVQLFDSVSEKIRVVIRVLLKNFKFVMIIKSKLIYILFYEKAKIY